MGATDDLKWAASIIDRISGPAAKMTKSLKGFEGGLKRADRFLQNVAGGRIARVGDKVIGGIGKSLAFAGRAAIGFGIAATAGFAAAGAGLAAFALKDTAEAENFNLALSTMLGDVKKFEAATKDIDGLANFWGVDPKNIEKQMLSLVGKGHDVADALKIIQGAGDLAVLGHDAQGLVDAFTMLDNKGKLSAKAVEKLLSVGLDPKKFRAALGDTIASTGDLQADIEAAIKSNTLDAAKLQSVALATITQTTGKALGGLAEKQSHTIGGLWTKLLSVPDRLMGAVEVGGGIEPLRKALESLTGALNPDSATGKKLADAISKVSTAIGRIITKITGDDGGKVGGWIDKLADGISIAADVIEVVADLVGDFVTEFVTGLEAILGPMGEFGGGAMDMKSVVKVLAGVFKFLGATAGVTIGLVIQLASWIVKFTVGAGKAIDSFAKGWSKFFNETLPNGLLDALSWFSYWYYTVVEWMTDVWNDFKDFGKAIVDGIWNGIKGAWGTLKEGWNKLVATLPATVSDKLKIQSPSKVMMELGGFAAEGFALGVDSKAANVNGAFADLTAAPPLQLGGGAAALRSIIVETNISIDGAGKNAKEIVREAGDEFEARLTRILGNLALEMGATG